IFATLAIVHVAFSGWFLLANYGDLTYQNQALLKSDKLYMFSFFFLSLTALALYAKTTGHSRSALERGMFRVLWLAALAVYCVTAIRMGQRSELVLLALGHWVYIASDLSSVRRQPLKWVVVA